LPPRHGYSASCLAYTNGLGLPDRTRSLKRKGVSLHAHIAHSLTMNPSDPLQDSLSISQKTPRIGVLAVLDDMMMVVSLLFSWQTIGGGIRLDGGSKQQEWRPTSCLKRRCGDSVRITTTTMMHQRFTTTTPRSGCAQ
jgi:hypothetical protein